MCNGKCAERKIIETWKQQGLNITNEQAVLILDFVNKLAAIFVSQYLAKNFSTEINK